MHWIDIGLVANDTFVPLLFQVGASRTLLCLSVGGLLVRVQQAAAAAVHATHLLAWQRLISCRAAPVQVLNAPQESLRGAAADVLTEIVR